MVWGTVPPININGVSTKKLKMTMYRELNYVHHKLMLYTLSFLIFKVGTFATFFTTTVMPKITTIW